MCTYSFIADQAYKDLKPWVSPVPGVGFVDPTPARVASLKIKIAALEKALKAAKIFDEAFDQPDCEIEEKVIKLQDLADELGVEIEFP